MRYEGKAKVVVDGIDFFFKGQEVTSYKLTNGEYDNMSSRRYSESEYKKLGLRDRIIVCGKESARVYSHEIEMI